MSSPTNVLIVDGPAAPAKFPWGWVIGSIIIGKIIRETS